MNEEEKVLTDRDYLCSECEHAVRYVKDDKVYLEKTDWVEHQHSACRWLKNFLN